MKTKYMLAGLAALTTANIATAKKPNIIIYFADDISAREFPIYGSSVWTSPAEKDTTDLAYRAKMPVVDKLAKQGCWIKTAWGATVCSPSRAMMMTGSYAHRHKWWHNADKGEYFDANGKRDIWPLYKSRPLQIGHLAQQAGYGTYWAGKSQMAGELDQFGFDEGCFTPGKLEDPQSDLSDFQLVNTKVNGKKELVYQDSGVAYNTYLQRSWLWNPHVRLMNDPSAPGEMVWWPNTPESKKNFGINTYGPDVELDFTFNFMERQQKKNKPFFIYHTTHLGHGSFNWFFPNSKGSYPGTPKITWDGEKYSRQAPHVTGDKGVYDTHDSISEEGIHSHINYIDYQIWQYCEKLKAMDELDNTIIIIAADNGTGKYGKSNPDRQKGVHVPFIIYAPGLHQTKQGEQDILLNLCDVMPTVAEMMGVEIPADYEIDGKSFLPWLTTDQDHYRDFLYSYRGPMQFIRGTKMMKDGINRWWNVDSDPADLISFAPVTNLADVSESHIAEYKTLKKILPQYDLHGTAHDAPGMPPSTKPLSKKSKSVLQQLKESEAETKRIGL